MLGVLLLSIILFYYAFVLLADYINNMIDSILAKQTKSSSFLDKIKQAVLFLQQEDIKKYNGLAALLFSLWNLFAPDFGAVYGPTLIGALIPAVVLFMDALILNPALLKIVHTPSVSDTVQNFLDKILPIAGWLNILVAVLHIIFYKLLFF